MIIFIIGAGLSAVVATFKVGVFFLFLGLHLVSLFQILVFQPLRTESPSSSLNLPVTANSSRDAIITASQKAETQKEEEEEEELAEADAKAEIESSSSKESEEESESEESEEEEDEEKGKK